MSLVSRNHARAIGSIPRLTGTSHLHTVPSIVADLIATQIPRHFYTDITRAAFTSATRSTPIPLSTLRLGHTPSFRYISTEPRQTSSDQSPPPPLSSSGPASTDLTKVPPPGSPPPSPPTTLSSIPPKVAEVAEEKVKQELAKKESKPKGSLPTRAWAVVKKEAAHYWAGTKLLGQEIKISAKLLRVVLRGEELTRRERRQVCGDLTWIRRFVDGTAATNDE